MDRLNQLRGEAGDSTLDTSSPPSEAFMSANENSSKYFSLSDVDSTFSVSPSKDAPPGSADAERTIPEETGIVPNLSPIPKTDNDTFKIGKHIEAANILSGGVNIFDDNENSYDGDELVIDDNVVLEDEKVELKLSEGAAVPSEKDVTEDTLMEGSDEAEAIQSKDTEVVLQIDGKNVDAIDIGNGLYLYRKSGEKELSAVQIIDDDQQQPSFKFLKVRENVEGNLEVYEEIQIEIPKEVPLNDGGGSTEKITNVPLKDLENKIINEPCDQIIEKINNTPDLKSSDQPDSEPLETQSEVNLKGKIMKLKESRKSPLTFTPMTYHSTPNKEGIPLTKTMVDQQLQPSRHSENIKKTIEVHTESKPKNQESKRKEINENAKTQEFETSFITTEVGNTQKTIVEHSKEEDKEKGTVNVDVKENENTGTKPTENLLVNLSNETISDGKLDEGQSQSNNKDETQLTDPIIEQTYTDKSKLSSISIVKTNTEIAVENKIVDETKKDDVVESSSSQSKPIIDPNTNTIADEGVKSDKISESAKDELDNNISSIKRNKDTSNESDNLEKTLDKNEKGVLKVHDLQISIHASKNSIESQIENVDNSVKGKAKQGALSLNLTKRDTIESQNLSKDVFESSKVPSKDTNIKTMLSKQIKQVEARKEIPKAKVIAKPNTCNSAVPFGKWTEANRQEFLNKIKETKIPSTNSNTNQIKQTNDLNRRDVLKKFDSQRQSTASLPTKNPDSSSVPKFSSKMETAAFVNKSAAIQQPNLVKHVIAPLKTQAAPVNIKTDIKKATKEEPLNSEEQIINSQELIDKTVEGIITRALKMKTTTPIHMKQQMTIHTVENPKNAMPLPGSLDYIEMKMNELHGFSFTEKPVQELSEIANHKTKACNKFEDNINNTSKLPTLVPFKSTEQQIKVKESVQDDTSDEEIIEHEPITGDIDVSKQNLISLLSCKEKFVEPKKDAIITETDFDKFAGRNSITYENCLTVNFDGKEKHNVVQTVVEKDTSVKKLSRNELLLAESKAKSSNKQNIAARHNNQASKISTLKSTSEDDAYNKNYQSKVQIAYQSALTAKRNLECPISMIEDKPVKVVFLDTNTEYTPTQLNVQSQELSPCKDHKADTKVHSASESLDSDIPASTQDPKPIDEKSKSKHQRKQVLTPVEQEPEIQLIEPSDLGIKVSPTKKRKIEEKSDKHTKNLVPKKSYLLNRVDEHKSKSDQPKTEAFTGHNMNTALDSLVKAAELIENQSESNDTSVVSKTTDTPQNTPVKRGRGRPRKYPLPEPGSDTSKTPSSQKKPRLIDAKPAKTYTDTDESSDGEIVKENWTMGKINENIVCPICSKLFRSEDVLFKHVKHCTGPSPNRSDSDKRSPRRLRNSQESERKLRDSSRSDIEDNEGENDNEDENIENGDKTSKPSSDIEDVIVIEDTPAKQNTTDEKTNHPETTKLVRKSKYLPNTNLVCELCGKTFRQLSYLVNHKLQHKNEDMKKAKKLASNTTNKSVFSCEVCRKEFRKLHHLVQHRIIHNPSSMASRSLRKTSSEVHESKHSKTDDASAGFRCEPCDKSFRKLHHLVEHRETHDGINKKGNTSTSQATTETSKSVLAHHCDICKKVFKKLQDLLEHKEQHYETSSEKSDDKSVKSSLSTKDIIHECSLCYMVFPNEHSLTKHTVICLRKKKQSAAKQAAKQAKIDEGEETPDADNVESEDVSQDIQAKENIHTTDDSEAPKETPATNVAEEMDQGKQQLNDTADKDIEELLEDTKHNVDVKPSNDVMPKKRHSNATSEKTKIDNNETPTKIKKVEVKERVKIIDTPTPKKKANKDKGTSTIIKKHKTDNTPLPVIDNVNIIKPMESSDEDEIRYMLNPNFKEEENIESKMFMKIRALKRNSLQIERPNSKDLVNRRISLQHPPKMPRLKAKPVEGKPRQDRSIEARAKVPAEKKLTPVTELTTDSDDSDVKYSFPEQETKHVERKVKRQSPAAKRKTLVGIAKRKSLGKLVMPKAKPKKRTSEVEHRCDCGKLFSSAALLSRHTTLDHTPPRIRRRRSPPPEARAKHAGTKHTSTKHTGTKPTSTKPTNTKPINKKPKPDVTNSNKTLGVATRKSSVSNEMKQSDTGKSVKSDSFKSLRSAKSVPVMKKLEKKK
ncbi:titin homolog [Maniola jurtina]|uniref:titin homolog n=1 Tax=Maniola jurtina TaxID=191418 RepID=UPI001E68E418|nr:titin homolog [Maniola jurtina]